MTSSPKKKQKWSTDSVHGGLLFCLFKDRIYDADDYASAEIYRDSRLPFQVYSGKNFRTYCQTAANKCKKFEGNGTGITPAFKGHVEAARSKYDELLRGLKADKSFDPDDDDESYVDSDAEDASMEYNEVEELTDLIRNSNLSIPAQPKSKKKSTKKSKTETTAPALHPICLLDAWTNEATKIITRLADDRILAAWKLETDWDGEIYIGDDDKSIMQDSIYRKDQYFDVRVLLRNTGLRNPNDIFLVEVHNQLNKTYERLKQKDANPRTADVTKTKTVFSLPFVVDRQLYDFHHVAVQEVPIDLLPTGEWAILVVKKKSALAVSTRRHGVTRLQPANVNNPAVNQQGNQQAQADPQAQDNFNPFNFGNAMDEEVDPDL